METPITLSDGFDEPSAASYALIASIYRSSGAFVQTLEEAFADLHAFESHLAGLQRRPGSVFLVAKHGADAVGYPVSYTHLTLPTKRIV